MQIHTSDESFPNIFDLPKEEGQGKAEERLAMLDIITLKESPAVVLRVRHPKKHVRVIWGIERLACYFCNLYWLDSKIVDFERDVAEGTSPPMVLVEQYSCYIQDSEVVSDAGEAVVLLGLSLTDTAISETTMDIKIQNIPLVLLAPLKLVAPLLKTPFLPQTAAYALINARLASLNLTEIVQPLLA